MLAISIFTLAALAVICSLAGVSGLIRKEAKNMRGLPSRRRSLTRVRTFIAERKWGIGMLVMFGVSAIAIGFASNINLSSNSTNDDSEDDNDTNVELPTLQASDQNPNLTRTDVPVILNAKGFSGAPSNPFDPANPNSLWGLGVDGFRVAYFGEDGNWHETSFQINEIGWRWKFDDDYDYMASGRDSGDDYGIREESWIENLKWEKGYVPDKFAPELNYSIFFPDYSGHFPGEAGMTMTNWPEFHYDTTSQNWGTSPTTTSQIRGAIDYDDEIAFLAKNGRKVENTLWYRPDLWAQRWEIEIVDPVDNGHSWFYIYFDKSKAATSASQCTPLNDAFSPYRDTLSYIAPGEYDMVSFDSATLTVRAENYEMKIDPNNGDQFTDLRITVPGLTPRNILSQFPKEMVWADGVLDFKGCLSYEEVREGLGLFYGMEGSWYQDAAPGTTHPSSGAASMTKKTYNSYVTKIGWIHHRGNPQEHGDYTYYQLQHGFGNMDTAGQRYASWWDFSGTSYPPNPIENAFAMRQRWCNRAGNPVGWGDSSGYWYLDSNLYVYKNGQWHFVVTFNDDSMAPTGYYSPSATIDGPVMLYLERLTDLKADIPLQWMQNLYPNLFALLVDGDQANDGINEIFNFYQQQDLFVYPDKFEIVNNTYPAPSLPDELYEYDLAKFHHMFMFAKVLQFDDTLIASGDADIYLGGGASTSDPDYGSTMNLLTNAAWTSQRNYDTFYNIEQVNADGSEYTQTYTPQDWMTATAPTPGSNFWPKTLNLDGSTGNDDGYVPTSITGSADYHPWYDYRWIDDNNWRGQGSSPQQYSVRWYDLQPVYVDSETPPRDGNNGNTAADWAIIHVPNGGDMWIYNPVREVKEIQSQASGSYFPDQAGWQDVMQAFKDRGSSDYSELGLVINKITLGRNVIPFTLSYHFGDFGISSAADALAYGKREWVRNRFQLKQIFQGSYQTPPTWHVVSFGPANGEDKFYKDGDHITLSLITDFNNPATTDMQVTDIQIDSTQSSLSPGTGITYIGPSGSYYEYQIDIDISSSNAQPDNVGPSTPGYYYINVTLNLGGSNDVATCGLFLDNTPPTAADFSLPSSNPSYSVTIDWTSSQGSDNSDDTYPPPDDSGLDYYEVWRSLNGGSWVKIDTVQYGSGTSVVDDGGYSNGDILQYRLYTFDKAGNSANNLHQTTISVPFEGGNFDASVPGYVSTNVQGANFNLTWADDPGDQGTITSYSISRSTSVSGGYTVIHSGISNTATLQATPIIADDVYWYKLISISGGSSVESSPLRVVHDSVVPSGASISPLPSYYAPTEYSIPLDATGPLAGYDPGYDPADPDGSTGSGVDYILCYRRINGTNTSLVYNHTYDEVKNNIYHDTYHYADNSLVEYACYSVDRAGNGVWGPIINFTFSDENIAGTPAKFEVHDVICDDDAVNRGSNFVVRVKVANTGGTDGSLDAGGLDVLFTLVAGGDVTSEYTYVSSNVSLTTTIPSGNFTWFALTYTAGASATVGNVSLDARATWNSGADTSEYIADHHGQPDYILVKDIVPLVIGPVSGPANPTKPSSDNSYSFTVTNNGDVDAVIDGSGLNITSGGSSANDDFTITLISGPSTIASGGGSGTFTYHVDVLGTTPDGAYTFDAYVDAHEQGYGADISDSDSSSPLAVTIGSAGGAELQIDSITDQTGTAPYVAGESFTVRVTYSNPGAVDAINVDGTLSFNMTGASSSNPAAITVTAGNTNYQDFVITLSTSMASGGLEIDCSVTGNEQGSGNPLSNSTDNTNDLTVQVLSQANLVITSIQDLTGTAPYVAGETFTVRVNYQNTGGADALSVDG
ncbi:MAG: hypothetical protein ACTSYS_11135, partial [Promethearchaeota archaeon]